MVIFPDCSLSNISDNIEYSEDNIIDADQFYNNFSQKITNLVKNLKPGGNIVNLENDEINKLKKRGIANIGYKPTFNGKSLLLEVNIFGIKKNLYKKILKVSFIKFIRSEKKFKNINQLKTQIKKDIISAKK